MEILIEGALDYSETKEWKKRYFVMKYEIGSGLRYIEIYKDKNWRKQLPRHVVNLHPGYEVKRIKNDPKKKYGFSLKTTDHCLNLAADDDNVMNQWLATFEEYNLVKSFCVQPQDTPTMVRIEAIYPCHLQMVHSEVRLVSAMDGKLLGLWPFKCIRRYKFTGNVFCIEAGRKAPTGEGMFEFISTECPEIYRVMDTIIRTKAGDTTIQRLASHKQPQHTAEKQSVRKTQSDPHASQNKTPDFHYDYATNDLAGQILPSPVSPPTRPVPNPPLPTTVEEDQYDELALQHAPTTDPQAGDPHSYDSLQFKDHEDGCNKDSSPLSYDTLSFNKQTDSPTQQTTSSHGYDKLQFNKPPRSSRNNSTSSLEGVETTLKPSVGDVYSAFNRPNVPEQAPKARTEQSAYDTLNAGQVNTYNTLGETIQTATKDFGGTYDHIRDTSRHASVKGSQPSEPPTDKPAVPARPPPRQKLGKANETPIPAPRRPPRKKPIRKAHSVEETSDIPASPPRESMKDVIQRRTASTGEDDGSYASVDHDYASIDYSKVSMRDTASKNSTNVYAEPTDVQTTTKPPPSCSPPKPAKPKRNTRPMKNLFKKNPPAPAVKQKPSPGDNEGTTFASELKKKLVLKKSQEGSTSKQNDDDIYSEVDDTDRGEMNV